MELAGAILNQGSLAGELASHAKLRRRTNKRSSVVKVRARRLNPFEIIDLVDRYEAGASTRQLASEFGVARTTIVKRLQARGVDTADRRVKRKLTSAQIDRCVELYRSGEPLAAIARTFDVHGSTVRRELLRLNIQLRPRQGWRYKTPNSD